MFKKTKSLSLSKVFKLFSIIFKFKIPLFWYTIPNSNLQNFGDILGPYLVEKLSYRKVILLEPKSKLTTSFNTTLTIGSIIGASNKWHI